MAGPGSVPGWLQLPCLATLHSPQELFNPTPDTSPALPSDKPAGGAECYRAHFNIFLYPFQLDIKTRQFQPANHFHSLPLPYRCVDTVFYLYHPSPHNACIALHCCCRMSGFRHFVLCQQYYIHIASIKGGVWICLTGGEF